MNCLEYLVLDELLRKALDDDRIVNYDNDYKYVLKTANIILYTVNTMLYDEHIINTELLDECKNICKKLETL